MLHSIPFTRAHPALRRLDHVICEVPDIDGALAVFHEGLGLPVAWPIGRYWTWGLTCGVALGGINLELLQPDDTQAERASIRRLSFEPMALSMVCDGFERLGIPYQVEDKIETDHTLLQLRGWDEESARHPQLLCTNVFPDQSRIAWDYFACQYAPFLRDRLATASFQVPNRVLSIVCGTTRGGARAADELAHLGLEEGVQVAFRDADTDEVLEIRMERGPLDLSGLQCGFRFV